MVFIPTVVYILRVVSSLSDCSQQHRHSYVHVIFISAYPAVRVKIYAYVNILGRNDYNKLTHYLLERKAIAASLQLCEGKIGIMQMTALVKGSVTRSCASPPPEAHVKGSVTRSCASPPPEAHVI